MNILSMRLGGFFAPHRTSGVLRPALVKAAITATTVVVCCLLFGPKLGVFGLLGGLVTFWETDRPLWPRVRNSLLITALVVASLAFGVAIAPARWAFVPGAVLIVIVFSMLYSTFMLGRGPSPVLPIYAGVVGAYFGVDQQLGWQLVGLTAFAGLLTTVLLLVPFLVAPHGPEERATARARSAVRAYAELPDDAPATVAQLSRNAAYAAMNDALVTLRSAWPATRGVRHRALGDELFVAQRELVTAMFRRLGNDAPVRTSGPVGSLVLRQPSWRYLAAHALHPDSVQWYTTWRMALAAALGGVASLAVGIGYPYWGILTAVIVLNQWMDRRSALLRAAQRTVGTLLGVGVVFAVSALHPGPWASVAVVLICMTGMYLAFPLNYAWALVCITPMALVLVQAATGAGTVRITSDRFLDTLIGAAAALVVMWVSSLGFPRRLARTQSRRSERAVIAVEHANERGRQFEPDGQHARVALMYELTHHVAVIERAVIDDPKLADLRAPEMRLADRGYAALGRAWLAPAEDDGSGQREQP
ncbi:FUSC family protein [Tsukamurella sp. NPDC003166]|uniref:FUSC family protein n=1 Tax=Tsukamurella sp. NPDC003166 TaxID=3154444 RepID=UPI0033B6259E